MSNGVMDDGSRRCNIWATESWGFCAIDTGEEPIGGTRLDIIVGAVVGL